MRGAGWFGIVWASLCCCVFCGCAWVQSMLPEGPPSDREILEIYYQTALRQSSSADVLAVMQKPGHGLLSQSESVVALWGQKKKGYKRWFNMVAFDEEELTVRGKYFFMEDERPRGLPVLLKQKMRFDTEMVLDKEVLDEPYANESARRVTILREVLESFHQDMAQVREDNRMLESSGMMVNRTFSRILQILDDMPVLASKLSDPAGLDFDHITLGKAKVRMVIRDDIVKVKIKIGTIVRTFGKQADVRAM